MEEYKPYDEMQDWFGRTTIHPLGLTLIVVLGIALLVLPRKWAFVPLLLLACVLSTAQRVVVGTLDFDATRILLLFGAIRLMVRGEIRRLVWSPVDTCFVAYATLGLAAFAMTRTQPEELTYRLGWLFDLVGTYFLLRWLFAGGHDLRTVGRCVALLAVVSASFFAVEYLTRQNLFSVFGGVPAVTWVRGGKLRCQGPFPHPIIAGCFWASLLPVVTSLWWSRGRDRWWAVIGGGAALFIILTTNSSTTYIAALVAFGAMAAYLLRNWMGWVMWGAAGTLVLLHMAMKAPVWHLLARATVFDRSTGWHRFYVIDQALRHIGDWWLLGTRDTNSWEVWDITNEYVWIAIEGGGLALAAFLAMIVFSFRTVGIVRRGLERRPELSRMVWALGCALFVHCTNFIGVSYFGQARIAWHLTIALIASQVPALLRLRRPAPQQAMACGGAPAVASRSGGL